MATTPAPGMETTMKQVESIILEEYLYMAAGTVYGDYSLRSFLLTINSPQPFRIFNLGNITPTHSVLPTGLVWPSGYYTNRFVYVTANCSWTTYFLGGSGIYSIVNCVANCELHPTYDYPVHGYRGGGGNGIIEIKRNVAGFNTDTLFIRIRVDGTPVLKTVYLVSLGPD